MVYRHYVVHPQSATIPALAACAAAKQGKFPQMEELIWSKGFATRDLGQENMEKLAAEAGADVGRLKADMEGSCKETIANDQRELAQFGVRGTPAFFVNGRFISGAQPYPNFKSVVDEEMKKANERIAAGTKAEAYYEEWVVGKGKKSL